MLLADWQIAELCSHADVNERMINPFLSKQVRRVEGLNLDVISCGLSSYGYDIRLSNEDFRIFSRLCHQLVDPKKFDTKNLVKADAHNNFGTHDEFFILPAHTYALGVSVEKFNIPSNITAVCMGKSTYARAGVIVNVTPLEAGWKGYLTIEISNSSCADVKVYANEGIAQLLFYAGQQCKTTYADRKGKYQDQACQVTLPKV